ncbi:MAG: DUF4302 domain-containing protein [Dysgonamonadaceae bacterium]|nr:DUF4302 domain-containing protein [Dysgonamonadaceae bacterium]
MKKILFLLIIFAGIMNTSCDYKMDRVFDESSDTRLQQYVDHYTNTLLGSPNGWIMTIYTGAGGVYRFWMNFSNDNRVVMAADFNSTLYESSYQIKVMQMAMLQFDTGSYLSDVCDPQPTVSGGTAGAGQISDFEFYFMAEDYGEILLRGRYNRTTAILKPATPAEAAVALEGALEKARQNLESYVGAMTFPVIEGSNGQKIQINLGSRSLTYQYIEDGSLVEGSLYGYADIDGLTQNYLNGTYYCLDLEFDGKIFTRFEWDESRQLYVAVSEDGDRYDLYDNQIPIYELDVVFGAKKDYNYFHVEKVSLAGSFSTEFLAIYDDINTKLNALSSRSLGYLDFRLYTNNESTTQVVNASTGLPMPDVLEVTFRYINSTGTGYDAQWYWGITIDAQGIYTFSNMTQRQPDRTNENNTKSAYQKAFDYINNNRFKLDWVVNNTPGSSASLGGFYVVDASGNATNSFVGGTLGKK